MTWRPKPAQILALVWVVLAAGQTARLVATGSLMSGDGVYHFAHLHSLVVDRDLDPVNEIRYFQEVARSPYTGQPKIGNRPPRNPATGEVVNKYPIGLALLVLPAYLAVYAVAHLLAAVGISADVTGYGWSYQYAASLLVAAYATLGLWCCQRVAASRDVNDADAWRATLLIAAATPWLFYATLEPLFSHALSATAAAVVVWQWLRARAGDRPIPWLMTGLAIGIGVLVRYQDVVLLLVPGLDLAARLPRQPRAAIACGLAVATGVLIGVAPQLAVNAVTFGHPFMTGYFGEGFPYVWAPRLLFTLWSPSVGLFRWAPITVVAVIGLIAAAWRGWPHARVGVVVVAAQLYLVASWYFVTQGHSFGNRMLVNATVFFVVGLAAVIAAIGGRPTLRVAALAAGVLLVAANVVLMALWSRGVIGPLGWLG